MTTTPEGQREARDALNRAMKARESAFVIHYADEGFDVPESRVTCIAARNLGTGQTASFSLTGEARLATVAISGATSADLDRLEKRMLDGFFAFVRQRQSHHWLHWNMRDTVYGFPALEARHKVLGGRPATIPDTHKLDLSPLMFQLFGDGYAAGPSRLRTLAAKNDITLKGFLEGSEQAAALAKGDYAAVDRSTLRKVDVLYTVADKAHRRKLKTDAPKLARWGGSAGTVIKTLSDHPFWTVVAFVAGVVGLVAAVAQLAGFG